MNGRFLLQRYCSANWPQVKGRMPFLATGPNFFGWAIKGSLERHGEHRFVQSFKQELDEVYGEMGTEMSRYCAAWALLQTGIVQALWADHSDVPEVERWGVAVDRLAAEIPNVWSVGEAVVEYLSGLSDPGHFRSYVSEDEIELVQMQVPQDA